MAFIDQHCIDCHQGDSAEAGLDLEKLSNDLNDAVALQTWVRIVDRVNYGEMPPPESSELTPSDRHGFNQVTSDWLIEFKSEQQKSAGRVPLRRLTNAQVERTLHDLMAIDIPLASLVPADPRTGGYTTIADGQPMSHFQLQSHLTIVDAALDYAFSRVDGSSDTDDATLDAERLVRRNSRQRCREPELIDGKAVTWSSGLIFYGRLPSTTSREDGWYEFTVRASAVKKPKELGVWCTVRSGKCISGAPLMSWIGAFEAENTPKERTYLAWLPKGHMLEIRPGDETLKDAKFSGGQVGTGEGGPQNVPGVALDWIKIQRVFPGGSVDDVRIRIFGVAADEFETVGKVRFSSGVAKAKAEQQIARFAELAFRRPLTKGQWQPYAEIFHELIASGEPPQDALKACYRAILCSPRFVYFYELPGELDSYAVANRLSYFLTGSMPDATLMKLAASDQLRNPQVLENQVERLLKTSRGNEFFHRFADEWLDLCDIAFTEPDRKLFSDFDQVVQNAMLAETRMYLADMLQRNASVAELIDSNHSFVNSRLARYYELEQPVQTDSLIKVALSPQDHRGGLMAQGSILKVTANGTNTSPVLRGLWLARRLLGETIPPPPAGVAAIEPDIRGATTIREQLEQHRDNANCASCHRKIDPPGFALEKFDPAGQFRTKYFRMDGGRPRPTVAIDTSYTLADGRDFADFEGFQELILADVHPIARNFVEHLLTFGTGAAPSFSDREPIRDIVNRCKDDDYGLRSLLVSTVTSPIFLKK